MQPPTPLPKKKRGGRSQLIKCAIPHEQGRTCTIWGDGRNVAHLEHWGGVALQDGMSGTMIPFLPHVPRRLCFSVVSLPISLGAWADSFSVMFYYSPIGNTRATVQNGSRSLGKLT